jgi:hypothetical protein
MTTQADTRQDRGRDERAPGWVRRAGWAVILAAVAGVVYLVTVRGEALLVDLTALGRGIWCF